MTKQWLPKTTLTNSLSQFSSHPTVLVPLYFFIDKTKRKKEKKKIQTLKVWNRSTQSQKATNNYTVVNTKPQTQTSLRSTVHTWNNTPIHKIKLKSHNSQTTVTTIHKKKDRGLTDWQSNIAKTKKKKNKNMNLREERNFLDLPCVTVIKDLRRSSNNNSLDLIWGKEQQQQ